VVESLGEGSGARADAGLGLFNEFYEGLAAEAGAKNGGGTGGILGLIVHSRASRNKGRAVMICVFGGIAASCPYSPSIADHGFFCNRFRLASCMKLPCSGTRNIVCWLTFHSEQHASGPSGQLRFGPAVQTTIGNLLLTAV
jgi:hypothetical protein